MYIGIRLKHALFLSDCNAAWFFRQVFENSSDIKFHEIHLLEAEFLHADRRTDMTSRLFAILRALLKAYECTKVAQKVMPHIFFSFQNKDINLKIEK
jgi:hypothetical protein